MKEIDARGRACPEPVMLTRNALLQDPEGAIILVDNPCAVENITRYARHAGYQIAVEAQGTDSRLTLAKV